MKNFMQTSKMSAPKAPKMSGAENAHTRLKTGQGVKVVSAAKPDKAGKTVDAGMVMPIDHPASQTTARRGGGTKEFVG